MRFLLESDHYVDDRLLPKGTEVGDGENAVHDWRHSKDIPAQSVKAGDRRAPSRAMSPLDEEARKAIKNAFGTDSPDRDPTKAIPLQGTGSSAKVPPLVAPTKPVSAPVSAKTPDPAVATVPPRKE